MHLLRHRRAGPAWDRRRDQAGSSSRSTFESLIVGDVEADGSTAYVSLAGVDGGRISVFRAYAKYLRQIGFAFQPGLHREHALAAPARGVEPDRVVRGEVRPGARTKFREGGARRGRRGADLAIDLDSDPAPRRRSHLSRLPDADGHDRAHQPVPVEAHVRVKLDPAAIPDLPRPRPMFETTCAHRGSRASTSRRAYRARRDPLERSPGGLPPPRCSASSRRRW